MRLLLLLFILPAISSAQVDTLSIQSSHLGKEVEVFLFNAREQTTAKPIVYLTDGRKMIDNGTLLQLSSFTKFKKIKPAYYVFVSTIDPKDPSVDHRNEFFSCNDDYLHFFENELVPQVEKHFARSFSPRSRSLIGISFGGLNGAFFSSKTALFGSYALLSPITYLCPNINYHITFSANEHLKVFLSTGKTDAENYVEPLRALYTSKGYTVKMLQTDGGHDFENWYGQMAEALHFLTGKP